jgi:hypothetical protein
LRPMCQSACIDWACKNWLRRRNQFVACEEIEIINAVYVLGRQAKLNSILYVYRALPVNMHLDRNE